MKKVISTIIAAAMLTASVYAEEAVEVVSAVSTTAVPQEEAPVAADVPPEGDIVYDVNEPAEDGVAFDSPYDTACTGDEVIPPEREIFPELGDIEKYLAVNGYPDYVSFIFNGAASVNGYDPTSGEEYQPKMTYWWDVGVVNATAAQKAEIQALIDELYPIENNITFIDCTYSYNERAAMIPEIRQTAERLFPEKDVFAITLIRNTEQIEVLLDVSDETEEEMIKEKLFEVYGDLVLVGGLTTVTDDGYDMGYIVPETEIGAVQPGMGGATTEIAMEEEEEIDIEVDEDVPAANTIPDAAPPVDVDGIAVGSNEDGDKESEIVDVIDDSGEPNPGIGGNVDDAPIAGGGAVTTTGKTYGEIAAITSPEKPADNNAVLWICIAAALVIALGAVAFIYRAKLIPVFATSHGNIAAGKLSKKQAEEAVKSNEVIPDDSILQSIKDRLD